MCVSYSPMIYPHLKQIRKLPTKAHYHSYMANTFVALSHDMRTPPSITPSIKATKRSEPTLTIVYYYSQTTHLTSPWLQDSRRPPRPSSLSSRRRCAPKKKTSSRPQPSTTGATSDPSSALSAPTQPNPTKNSWSWESRDLQTSHPHPHIFPRTATGDMARDPGT